MRMNKRGFPLILEITAHGVGFKFDKKWKDGLLDN